MLKSNDGNFDEKCNIVKILHFSTKNSSHVISVSAATAEARIVRLRKNAESMARAVQDETAEARKTRLRKDLESKARAVKGVRVLKHTEPVRRVLIFSWLLFIYILFQSKRQTRETFD